MQNYAQNETQTNQMQVDETVAENNKTNNDVQMKDKQKVVEVNKRGLRRKVDNEDMMMRKLKLEAFEDFKENVLFRDDFSEITSNSEIKAIQSLFQRRSQHSTKLAAADTQPSGKNNYQHNDSGEISSMQRKVVPDISLLD